VFKGREKGSWGVGEGGVAKSRKKKKTGSSSNVSGLPRPSRGLGTKRGIRWKEGKKNHKKPETVGGGEKEGGKKKKGHNCPRREIESTKQRQKGKKGSKSKKGKGPGEVNRVTFPPPGGARSNGEKKKKG